MLLCEAVRTGLHESVRQVLDMKLSLDVRGLGRDRLWSNLEEYLPPTSIAVKNGRKEILKLLIDCGAETDVETFLVAVRQGDLLMVVILLDAEVKSIRMRKGTLFQGGACSLFNSFWHTLHQSRLHLPVQSSIT